MALGRKSKHRVPLAWDPDDDSSAVVYRPRPLVCFLILPACSEKHETVLRDSVRNRLRRFVPGSSWDYSFFIGNESLPSDSAHIMGDIVHLRVPDDYASLGRKVVAALKWSVTHVTARYLLKVDQDTWLDMRSITELSLIHI